MIVPRVVFFVVSHPRVHVSAAGMLADEWGGNEVRLIFLFTSGTEMLVELLMNLCCTRAWHS